MPVIVCERCGATVQMIRVATDRIMTAYTDEMHYCEEIRERSRVAERTGSLRGCTHMDEAIRRMIDSGRL